MSGGFKFIETLPPVERIFEAAERFRTEAGRSFLETAIRAALQMQRSLAQPGPMGDVPQDVLAMLAIKAESYSHAMRDTYLTAAVEMLKMLAGDFEPEPWTHESREEIEKSIKPKILGLYERLREVRQI